MDRKSKDVDTDATIPYHTADSKFPRRPFCLDKLHFANVYQEPPKKRKKKHTVEMPGIEPGAFHMRSERSTTEPHPQTPLLCKFDFTKHSSLSKPPLAHSDKVIFDSPGYPVSSHGFK